VLASQSISIQIDPPAAIESLQVVPRQLRFNYPGERVQLRVEGMLADGLAADLSASNRVLFFSEDAQVASVAADGVVTAIGGGTTKLIVSGGGNSVEVPILVASAEPGDLNVDGAVDQHDMNVLLASLGLSAGPFDVRDLNGDGVIDATDVVQYSGMCAPSGCSVPQENVLVPALIGAQRLDAQQKIAQAQLVVGLVTEQYNAVIPPGEVLAQLPSAWASVEFGSAVDLVVALGPAAIVVPDVTGSAQADAEAAILAAGLTVGTVTTANSPTVPAGNVISQNPAAGTNVAPGSPVDLVVSLGPAPVAVPDVTGQPQAVAEAAIVAAGLTVGTVTTANSPTVPAGNVISQNPAAGTNVAPGSPVDLVVSLGQVVNKPPDCGAAVPSVSKIWPPNHRFERVRVHGVTDREGPVSIKIDSIRQDEPTETNGYGDFCPDGKGIGTAIARVRAERAGTKKAPGDGRVYHIDFTATDDGGAQCIGTVKVCVPRDQGKQSACADGGPLHDSTNCQSK